MRRLLLTRSTAIAAALLLCLSACGATARQKALDTTLVALDAARDGFVAYDTAHQAAIVEHATTKEAGAAALAAWRLKRDAAADTLLLAYSALAAAALDATAETLAEAGFAAARAYQAFKALQGSPP